MTWASFLNGCCLNIVQTICPFIKKGRELNLYIKNKIWQTHTEQKSSVLREKFLILPPKEFCSSIKMCFPFMKSCTADGNYFLSWSLFFLIIFFKKIRKRGAFCHKAKKNITIGENGSGGASAEGIKALPSPVLSLGRSALSTSPSRALRARKSAM